MVHLQWNCEKIEILKPNEIIFNQKILWTLQLIMHTNIVRHEHYDCQLTVKLWKDLNFKTKQGGLIKRSDQFNMNINIKEKDEVKGWKTYNNDK